MTSNRGTRRGTWVARRQLYVASALTLVSLSAASRAEQDTTRVSPHESATHVVDAATITITYGRPSKRGRAIFGALIPFGEVWMPGADESTILQTSAGLRFGSVSLPAGSYSLYTIPSAAAWKLIINKQTGQWHTEYNADRDFARLDMRIDRLPQAVEQLTIVAAPVPERGGELRIDWDTTRAAAPFTVLK
ncbi:MAG: DUF2911 domain-containing protein [Acidobacteria bacterium]|nr:DUF2911 domain-containing protein [Acidobacteriota bacterium]